MYENVAGIDFDESAPANERIVIWPRAGGGLTHAQASYDSIRGRIEATGISTAHASSSR
jgi:hypothetical protein